MISADSIEQQIVVCAPTGKDAAMIAAVLDRQNLSAQCLSSVREVCEMLPKGPGALLIAEEALDIPALQLLTESLRKQPSWSDIPVIVLTASGAPTQANLKNARSIREIGNITLLERPLRTFTLTSTMQSALRSRGRQYEVRGLLSSLERAKEEAEGASRAKDEFLAVCSHELRTPLTPILGWARLLRAKKNDPASLERGLEIIERNVKAQGQLIEDLLDISRIVSGKMRLNTAPVELAKVIDAALETVRTAADAKQLRLEACFTETPIVSGDAGRLQQVVWNLLNNAIKFTPPKGLVQVRLKEKGAFAEISVADNGEGMAPEYIPFLFKRFSQADSTSTRSHGGLGLGLSIVRHLIELHGGSVGAHSGGKGQGSEFSVKIPIANAPVEIGDSGPIYRTLPKGDALPYLDGLQVLVVDDEHDSREFIAAALEQWGARVTTAGSAEEALRSIAILKPNVLVSDIGMPVEDGYALIRRLREQPAEYGGRIPAVALTAYARAEDRMRALSEGFQMHVPKPVEPSELATVVAKLAAR